MKYLVAIVLLVLAVAEANHVPEHTLRGPRFEANRLYKYKLDLNVTSGVLGLSSQVSAAVLRANVDIFAKTEKDFILKIQNVLTSGSVKSMDSKYGAISLQSNQELEDKLSSPITFTLEDGKITSYTLSVKETLESKKIKKSILRSLEMYVSDSALQELESKKLNVPVTYNTTEDTEYGEHTTQYMIIASSSPEFPSDKIIYNISRSDNFEAERYPSHKLYHNFQKQGCSEVCRKVWRSNDYGAGCPIGHEPHQSPIKTSFSHQHDLSIVGNVLSPDLIRTTEVHFAKMYDQDLEVLFRFLLTRYLVTSETLPEPSGQESYTDLSDMDSEINEKEIDDLCDNKNTGDYANAAKTLLTEISKLIVKGELESDESSLIGEKIILLRDILTTLSSDDLQTLSKKIKSKQYLPAAKDEEKVERQVWLNILPVVGTSESIKFIVKYVQDDHNMLKWEIKDILEALPQNIQSPSEEDIRQLRELTGKIASASHHLHSATYLSLARLIGKTCGNIPIIRSESRQSSSQWFEKSRSASRSKMSASNTCPESLVSEIVEEVTRKLRSTRKPQEIAVYIETLSHIGTSEVLPVISEYIYGSADNLQDATLRFVDFTKTMAQHVLHNIAGKYPEEVLQIVLPVYFNETESPKVRNAAFGVLIRSQPSLDILQKVAIHSWVEKSNEVGSYVTSALETFGNSSLPCMQLTAHRIKVVLPQLRRFDIGVQHAKNYFWSYFDSLREFGLEGRFEYTPNNESYIPSVLYKSLSYSMDSLRDVVLQTSLNIEGLTQEGIMEKINEYLKYPSIPTIEDEVGVFGDKDSGLSFIKSRTPDDLRFTFYGKAFYHSSFYYFDASTLRQAKDDIKEFLMKYLVTSKRAVKGHLVKLMIPSSYHTVTIAKTLPYPVEFQMRQPIVLALSVKSTERNLPRRDNFNLELRPSVYLSKLFTHQLKNLGDCKEIGVYHEHKIAISYPFQLKYEAQVFPNITIKYKVPPTNQRILSYFTESGTYVGKKDLTTLPSSIEREPITTLPTPFKFERELRIVGIPPLHVELSTEDMNLLRDVPRDPLDALDIAVRRILNAGWRQKSVNITVLEDNSIWSKETEVTFNIKYLRQHVSSFENTMGTPQDERESWKKQWSRSHQSRRQWQSSKDEDTDWTKYLEPVTIDDYNNPSAVTERARSASRILNYILPHINHVLNISVDTEPEHSTAYLRMEYNHTYNKNLHTIHVDAATKLKEDYYRYEMSLDHVMGYWNKPDEFTYDSGYGNQQAGFISALSLPQGGKRCPWEQVQIAVLGNLKYVSNKETLEDELLNGAEDKYFLPESHDQCQADVLAGQALSIDCVKAITELSTLNRLKMSVLWEEALPVSMRQFFRRADVYMKHYFFEHLNVTEAGRMNKGIQITMDYIDKLVDEPVVDLELSKPSETVTFERIPVGDIQPLSSVYSLLETHLLEITNNSYPPTCTVMEKYVKTYDLKTYPFKPEECHYVLSTHCTKRKNFAIILHGTQEIYIHVAAHTVILASSKSGAGSYSVKFNGEEHEIKDSLLLDEDDEIYAFLDHYAQGHDHIAVVARRAGIEVLYDGKNIKITVDPRYKGELCGLCSEFDGEELREYRGIDRCLYENYLDFINSALVKRNDQCKVEGKRGGIICDGGETKKIWGRGSEDQEDYEPRTTRNIVLPKGNEVCFSVNAVPVCEGDDTPTETENQRVGFHCLPKRDATARKMVTEAKWRVLEELERKSVDYEDSVEVAKMC